MSTDIPLLFNHEHTKPIGMWKGNGVGEFNADQRITREQLFNIFGGAGIRVREMFVENGALYIRAFEILEFSLLPEALARAELGDDGLKNGFAGEIYEVTRDLVEDKLAFVAALSTLRERLLATAAVTLKLVEVPQSETKEKS